MTSLILNLPFSEAMPNHWRCLKLKHVASIRLSNVDKKSVEGERTIFLCNYVDVYNNAFITEDIVFMEATATESQIERYGLKAGDVLITKDSEAWDDIAVPALVPADLEGVLCGYHLALIRPKTDVILGRFLAHAFSAEGIADQFRVAANGITRFGLGMDEISDAFFPVPPLDEQQAIANYLERKTAKIDDVIATKQRMIELLHKKRQALISEVVTKGIESDVPMIDSGLDWSEMVPAHWTPKKLKHLYRRTKRQCHSHKIVLSVYRDYGVIEKSSRDDNHNRTPEDLSVYQLVEPGNLVVNKMKAWQGFLGVSEHEGITSPDYVVFEHRHQENSRFLHHLLRIPRLADVYRTISNGIRPSQWRLEPEDFLKLTAYLPPLEEQHEIVTRIDEITNRDGRISTILKRQIELLSAYRLNLISAAATGKIDLSGDQAVSPEKVQGQSASRPNPYFRRTVFAAAIIDRLCGDATFGHVKFQKCMFIAQHHLGVADFEENYKRAAAGPYDNRLIRSIDSQVEKQGWFRAEQVGSRYTYRRLEKVGGHQKYFEGYFREQAEPLNRLLDLFRPMNTDQAEIVATLYAVWNDFLIRGEAFDDDRLVEEVLTNWDDTKKRFGAERWHKAIVWMREKGLVPSGSGKPTNADTSGK